MTSIVTKAIEALNEFRLREIPIANVGGMSAMTSIVTKAIEALNEFRLREIPIANVGG